MDEPQISEITQIIPEIMQMNFAYIDFLNYLSV